jgi:hypothetical protein
MQSHAACSNSQTLYRTNLTEESGTTDQAGVGTHRTMRGSSTTAPFLFLSQVFERAEELSQPAAALTKLGSAHTARGGGQAPTPVHHQAGEHRCQAWGRHAPREAGVKHHSSVPQPPRRVEATVLVCNKCSVQFCTNRLNSARASWGRHAPQKAGVKRHN